MKKTRATRRLDCESSGIHEAGAILRSGGLLAFPTETVYGLGGDATNGLAVAKIYEAKGRPSFNPLIIHVASFEQANELAYFNENALVLAKAFWPGPLTLVLPRRSNSTVSELALAGLDSIAIRIPSSPAARSVLSAAGRPIAAPSANRSGRLSPTRFEDVLEDLDGLIDGIVMGDAAEIGLESTIVSCLANKTLMLRPGGVPREAIERELGQELASPLTAQDSGNAPLAPGMLLSHYAPKADVRLDAREVKPGEAALLFGPNDIKGAASSAFAVNLSPTGDLREAAANLFSGLRKLDALGARIIAVSTIPEVGLGEAINDRLRRAAAPRG
jgi:L-threonylcarbamoyladenylate synthase